MGRVGGDPRPLAGAHGVELIAIGNGTASRETDKLAADLIARHPQLNLTKVMVSEAGASVYSASAYASQELPGMDVSLRGAVSIARRLQDPLAELVKIDPRSIGVGQYQHDLSEVKLSRSLDAVVEDCVNAVGVDVNTASAPLLTRVSGIGAGLAENIVLHRDANGPFRSRTELKKVARLGPKAFEQCAGFLRIPGGDDPLDSSSVHPEAYPVVRRILARTGQDLRSVIGRSAILRGLRATDFVDDRFGLPTVTDILAELEKPGRDPRPEFRTATFVEGVEKISDLTPGMVLEGVVTNVAAFGAFVDVGVHQDGLVHVSAMSRTFVKDPREVVKSGDVVKVRVLDVDVPRKRISLTLRLDDEPPASGGGRTNEGRGGPAQRAPQGGRGGQGGSGGGQGGRGGQGGGGGGGGGGRRWWRRCGGGGVVLGRAVTVPGRVVVAAAAVVPGRAAVPGRAVVAAGSSATAHQRRPMTRWRRPCAAPDWPDPPASARRRPGCPETGGHPGASAESLCWRPPPDAEEQQILDSFRSVRTETVQDLESRGRGKPRPGRSRAASGAAAAGGVARSAAGVARSAAGVARSAAGVAGGTAGGKSVRVAARFGVMISR